MRIASTIIGVLLLVVTLTACGQEPTVPTDDAAMFTMVTGENGQDYLREISGQQWEDRGQEIGERFLWIGNDAASPDDAVARRSGEAAHALATFLATNKDSLSDLSAGIFGLQHRSLGELNPDLLRAYAFALVPFQGALVGDFNGTQGFEPVGDAHGDLSPARNIFTVVDTDTEAGNTFSEAAYSRVRRYLEDYGRTAVGTAAADPLPLRRAAELAGVVEGARRATGDASLETRSAQSWINWAGYELAAAQGVRPGDADIPDRFFSPAGRLLTPDKIPPNDLDAFATAVENFAFHHGAPTMGTDFDRWYDAAAET